MIFRAAVAATSVLLALTACGGDPSPQAGSAETKCEAAPKPLLETIASKGDGITAMKSGEAYKSPDFENVWFVAGKFSADGVDDQTGVWATNALDGTGSVMAVDGTAQQFTTWPKGEDSAAKISGSDPAVKIVKGC